MASGPLRSVVDLFKALGHPVRLRILALLREGELCVCQIKAVVGLPTSTVSEHLAELRRAGLLEERKDGRWVYYMLKPQAGLEAHLDALWPSLRGAELVAKDLAASKQIRQVPVEITCMNSKPCRAPAKNITIVTRNTKTETQP